MAATPQLSRRAFARLLGLGGGVALAAPMVARGFEEGLGLAAGAPALPHKRLPKDPENLILLNSNENAYGPSPAAREAMMEGFEVACRYPDFYIDHLQAKLAEYYGVDPDEVIVTAGSTELLKMCAYAFLGRGKRLVQASPTFEALAGNARMVDAEVVKIPLDKNYQHNLDAMAEAAQARPGLVYLCNPNNPTGTVIARAAIKRFLQRIPQESVVLVDEAYHHYVEDPGYGSLLDAVKAGKKIVVARTFSKIYGMAGLRIGYGIAPRALIQRLRPHWVWSSANVLGCVAAAASLEDEEFAGLNARRNREARNFIVNEMDSRGHGVIPSHTNFICIDVQQPVRPVIAAFREQGIRVGRPFEGLPQHIRLSLGLPEELEKFVKAFDLVFARKTAN